MASIYTEVQGKDENKNWDSSDGKPDTSEFGVKLRELYKNGTPPNNEELEDLMIKCGKNKVENDQADFCFIIGQKSTVSIQKRLP